MNPFLTNTSPGIFIDPTTDAGFKILFGRESSKDILISLLNTILEKDLDAPITDLTFIDKEKLREADGERTVIFDLHCVTSTGHRFIVEMQNMVEEWFIERCLLYASRAISEQSKSGKWDYFYSPVISIAFTNFTLTGFEGQYMVDGSLVDRYSSKLLTDRMRLIFIQLPQFPIDSPEECTSVLEEWIFTIKNLKNMESIPFAHRNPVFKRVEDLARKENLTTDERREYERNLKHYQDYYSSILYASKKSHAEGLAEGRAEGRSEGLAEGLAEGRIQEREAIIASMRANGLNDDQIAKILSTSIHGEA